MLHPHTCTATPRCMHSSACVSIRQRIIQRMLHATPTLPAVCIRPHASAYVSVYVSGCYMLHPHTCTATPRCMHTSACVSIRQRIRQRMLHPHTCTATPRCMHTSACVSIRQRIRQRMLNPHTCTATPRCMHTSAYVSIRQRIRQRMLHPHT